MKKTLLTLMLAFVAFAGASSVKAQEAYLGAQFVRVNANVHQPNFNFDKNTDNIGVVGSYTSYLSKNFGLTGEASANFNGGDNKNQLYTVMGGVTLKSRASASFQPFVSGLAGVGVLNVSDNPFRQGDTSAGPAFKATAGFDVGKGKVKWRVLEAGLLQTHTHSDTQNNFVLSSGILW